MRSLLVALLLAPALGVVATPALSAQPVVPAHNIVVFRRQQTYGSASYTWAQFQDAALVQTSSATAFTVPAGQHFVVTGIHYWFTGTNGGDFYLGPFVGGNVTPLYMRRLPVTPSGSLTTLEGSEQFTTGISFPSGTKVDIKMNKSLASSSDTVVWLFLYGYLENN